MEHAGWGANKEWQQIQLFHEIIAENVRMWRRNAGLRLATESNNKNK